jgi:ABC-type lipoprotein export system ATPase subunit
LVELDGVGFAYPGRDGTAPLVVVDHFRLRVQEGEFVCLAGRSGSGKTTLLHLASGLLAPGRGAVRWRGEDVAGLPEREAAARRRELFGIVLQGGGLVETLTAEENVALPGPPSGTPRGSARARASGALDRVGLAGRGGHLPSQLSGGEQQRVGIARALYADPAMLVADEPTANLDRVSADQVIELLASLHTAGQTLLVATHDEHLIAAAERVVRLG